MKVYRVILKNPYADTWLPRQGWPCDTDKCAMPHDWVGLPGTGFNAVHTIGLLWQIETELTQTMTPSWRYVLAWMGCFGFMNVYFCRINLSVAMVAMVGIDPPAGPANSSCGGSESDSDRDEDDERVGGREGEFRWSKPEQGMVTASYYWGYATCQVQQFLQKKSPMHKFY